MTAKEFIEENQNGVLLNDYSLTDTIWFMEKYSEEVLKIAAEKAKTEEKYFPHELGGYYKQVGVVNKESILNCLK